MTDVDERARLRSRIATLEGLLAVYEDTALHEAVRAQDLYRALEAANADLQATATAYEQQAEEAQTLSEQLEQTNAELQATNDQLADRVAEIEEVARALTDSEARSRFLAEAIPVQVWTAMPDGRLDFVTHRVADYFGRPAAELLGDGWVTALHPDDRARAFDRWAHSLRTGEPYEVEFRLLSAAEGTYRWHLARAHPFADSTGRIVKWFGSNVDVEERKRSESAATSALADSEHERVREQAAHEAHERFVHMLSHELRTPIGAIGGYAELLLMGLRGTITDVQRSDLERIRHNERHLRRLIDDLLLLAKLDAGQLPLESCPVRLTEVIADAHTMVAPQLDAKSLVYHVRLDEPDLAVVADRDRLQQVLINLLANAVKFTDARGSITISADVTTADAHIHVTDTGCGIPEDTVDRIFEPFVQIGAPRTRSNDGTGLGLSISREFARRMQGDLTVRSRLGVGTTFTLRLPRAGAAQ